MQEHTCAAAALQSYEVFALHFSPADVLSEFPHFPDLVLTSAAPLHCHLVMTFWTVDIFSWKRSDMFS